MAGDSDIEMTVSTEINVDECREIAKKHFDLVSIKYNHKPVKSWDPIFFNFYFVIAFIRYGVILG